MLPGSLKKYFWDARPETIDMKKNKDYIIARLLELGDDSAIRWLEETYSQDQLQKAIGVCRSLSPKSRSYWKLKYHLA
jgi:hypothetical protein